MPYRSPSAVFAMFAAASVVGSAYAAAPNDECGSPSPISGVGQWSLDDLLTATLSTSPPSTIPIITRDVWYCWTPTWSGLAQISLDPVTLGNTTGPTLLGCEVYAGCGCPAVGAAPLATLSPSPGSPVTATFQVECGQQYMIRMGGERYPSPPGNPLRNFGISKVEGQDCPPPAAVANTNCCGGKPSYDDPLWTANYTGQVAVVSEAPTGYAPFFFQQPLITIFNLGSTPAPVPGNPWNPVTGAAPSAFRYAKPQWDQATLGSIFALTLDSGGNIYTAYCAATNATAGSSLPGSTSGSIFKIPTGSGVPTVFCNIPDNAAPPVTNPSFYDCGDPLLSPPGIGDVVADCAHGNQFFASNFADGRVYRITSAGVPVEAFDHATNAVQPPTRELNNTYDKYVPRGERVWAVKPFQGRLYYSVWGQEIGWFWNAPSCQTSSQLQPNSQPNTIWSVALTPTGAFVPNSRRMEFQMPIVPTAGQPVPSDSFYQSSAPVSDIDFDSNSHMIVAERQVLTNGVSVGSHKARGFELAWNGSAWTPVNDRAGLGLPVGGTPTGYQANASARGGCAVDFTSPPAAALGRTWFTGDYLFYDPTSTQQYTYGITGLDRATPLYSTAIHVDYDGSIFSTDEKARLCDVEIPCVRAVCGMASAPEILCNYPQSQGYTVNFQVNNASSVPATYVLISAPPGCTVSPNVIKFNTPIPAGGTSGPLSFTFTCAQPQTTPPCFHITLVDEKFTTCCSFDWCPPTLPKCDCGQLLNFTVACVPNQPGAYSLTFNVQNLTSTPVSGFFIVKEPPFVSTQIFTPNFFAIPTLAPGQISGPITTTITGLIPGQQFCFKVAFTLCENCCAIRKCFTPPPCPGGPTVVEPCAPGQSCYANCDGSTATPVLSPADFTCFLERYRNGDACANCDNSTATPVLSPADFTCFLAKYRTGCP